MQAIPCFGQSCAKVNEAVVTNSPYPLLEVWAYKKALQADGQQRRTTNASNLSSGPNGGRTISTVVLPLLVQAISIAVPEVFLGP